MQEGTITPWATIVKIELTEEGRIQGGRGRQASRILSEVDDGAFASTGYFPFGAAPRYS